jgi:carbon-monoxide dehydrogenase large subunit
MGQGLETTYAAMVAERLGIDIAAVTVVQGDTDLVQGLGTVGSRSAFVGGSAVAAGADELVATGTRLAAETLEAAASDIEFADGRFVIAGTDRAIGLFELAGRQPERRLAVKTTHTVDAPSWPNGCHVCEVEIDPETGVSTVTRYVTVDDVGRALNETLVRGQIHGGIAQGIGQALWEHALYDCNTGQLLAGSFMDYTMPRADVLPSFEVTIDQSVPCRTNRLGVKGCGESGTVGATPAVMSAVIDALRPLGIGHLDMPATPRRVWEAIQTARRRGTP